MNRPISRREALRRGLGASLALGLWPGALAGAAASASPRFRFLVVNDTHYATPGCAGWLRGLTGQMRSHEGVAFCLHLGDITDRGQPEHLLAARDLLAALDKPIYATPGNHDYPATGDRHGYDQAFPSQQNYDFAHGGWQFIGVDSTEGQKYEGTRIPPGTLEWLDRRLGQLDRRRPTVLFTHFPLGEGVRYRPLNAEGLLERFLPLNLQGVFSGHYHGFTERRRGSTFLVTNRCCALLRDNHDGTREKGYWLCTAAAGQLTREFVPYAGARPPAPVQPPTGSRV